MSNVSSGNIEVFPTTKRTSSRLWTEKHTVSIINKLIDNEDGFVISNDLSSGISFNVYGYYFNINSAGLVQIQNLISSGTGDVYAKIIIENDELKGQDEGTVYKGVEFVTSLPSGEGVHSLKILSKTNNGWIIPNSSKIKFNTKSLNIDLSVIDGGVIS